jgi:hypothetical protein
VRGFSVDRLEDLREKGPMTMTEVDAFASATDGYTIVVAGNLNPAIHHPAWYKAIGVLSDEELSGALAGALQKAGDGKIPIIGSLGTMSEGEPICSPLFAQFTVGRMRLICIPQNWTIATYDQALISRIVEITIAVFEALPQTPVSAYGLNFNFHRKTGTKNIGARMAQIVDATQFPFLKELNGSRSARVGYTIDQGARVLNISLEPSVRSPDTIFASLNAHHPIPAETGFRYFDLTPLLKQSVDQDLNDAKNLLSEVIAAFDGDE